MWLSIARATPRPLRLASVRRAGVLTAELAHHQPQLSAAAAQRFAALLCRRQFISVTRVRPAVATATERKRAAVDKATVNKVVKTVNKLAKEADPKKKKAATKKAAPKKKKAVAKKAAPKKKKKVVAKKKAAPKKKKEVSEERQRVLMIRELKRTALLSRGSTREPKARPVNTWQIYTSKHADALKGVSDVTTALPSWVRDLAASFKALSEAERQALAEEAERNKKLNETELNAWVDQHKVEEIARINAARNKLRRLGVHLNTVKTVKDHRVPKRQPTSFMSFVKMRWSSGDMTGTPATQAMRKLAADWRALSPAEKQPFVEAASAST